VVCSALGPPGAVTTSFVRYGQGIDKYTELINLASDVGIINKGGAWYTITVLDDKPKFQGTEKVRNFLLENTEAYILVEKSVKEVLGIK
jgi:recombination protein RecA